MDYRFPDFRNVLKRSIHVNHNIHRRIRNNNANILSSSLNDTFFYELYIRELSDKSIDTYELAKSDFSLNPNQNYIKKMNFISSHPVFSNDPVYYYELLSFCSNYNINIANINSVINNDKVAFRYFCYRYLNYMKNFKIHDIPKNSEKNAVLIEFRKFPHLEFLIRNAINKLPKDWAHTIVCGTGNYEFIKTMCDDMCDDISANINIVKYEYDNLDVSQYSTLLASKEFWNNLVGEKILLYQEDSCIFGTNIDDYLEYDYIGAPWLLTQNDNKKQVGNGGFSLRSKSVMLKVIDTISITDTEYNSHTVQYMKNAKLIIPPEDVYFSKNIIDFNLGVVADHNIAQTFSVERIPNDKPFGGHNFHIAIKDWKQLMYNRVVVQFCPPINLYKCLSQIEHRGGWKYILNDLIRNDFYNSNSKINFIDSIEYYHYFKYKYTNPHNKYILCIHGTQSCRYDNDICMIDTNFNDKSKDKFQYLNNCLAICTFSNYNNEYITNKLKELNLNIPVITLYHPTNFDVIKFDLEKYLINQNKKIIQLGQQMRYNRTIYDIKVNYTKIWLPGLKSQKQVIGYLDAEKINTTHFYLKIVDKNADVNKLMSNNKSDVNILYFMNYTDYDKLFIDNLFIMNLIDANANNAILECIIRDIPIIVNRLPAVEEYIGKDYPLYFNSIDEISELLTDENIIKAHNYLKNMDKSRFSIEYFRNDIMSIMNILKSL